MRNTKSILKQQASKIFDDPLLFHLEVWPEVAFETGSKIVTGIRGKDIEWAYLPSKTPIGQLAASRVAKELRERLEILEISIESKLIPVLAVRKKFAKNWGVYVPELVLEQVKQRMVRSWHGSSLSRREKHG